MTDKPATATDGQGVNLPQTDAGTTLQLLLGVLALTAGTILLLTFRTRTN